MLHQKFRETLPCPLAARRFENSIVFVEAVIDNPERLHGREERANFELSDDDGLFNFELTLPHERAVDNDFIHEELLHISQNAAKPYGVMPNIKEPRAKL